MRVGLAIVHDDLRSLADQGGVEIAGRAATGAADVDGWLATGVLPSVEAMRQARPELVAKWGEVA